MSLQPMYTQPTLLPRHRVRAVAERMVRAPRRPIDIPDDPALRANVGEALRAQIWTTIRQSRRDGRPYTYSAHLVHRGPDTVDATAAVLAPLARDRALWWPPFTSLEAGGHVAGNALGGVLMGTVTFLGSVIVSNLLGMAPDVALTAGALIGTWRGLRTFCGLRRDTQHQRARTLAPDFSAMIYLNRHPLLLIDARGWLLPTQQRIHVAVYSEHPQATTICAVMNALMAPAST